MHVNICFNSLDCNSVRVPLYVLIFRVKRSENEKERKIQVLFIP